MIVHLSASFVPSPFTSSFVVGGSLCRPVPFGDVWPLPYRRLVSSRVPSKVKASAIDSKYLFSKSKTFEKRLESRTLATTGAYFKHLICENSRILDVGCGPGSITASFHEACADGEVVGIDMNADVVKTASEKHPHVRFLQANIVGLPFENDYFDIVHMHQVLQYLSDPVAGIREMKRVCKPGGAVVMSATTMGRVPFYYPPNKGFELFFELLSKSFDYADGDSSAAHQAKKYCDEVGFEKTFMSIASSVNQTKEAIERVADFWAGELQHGSFGARLRKHGLMGDEELKAMIDGWARFKDEPGAFTVDCSVQIVCTK